MAGSAVQRLFGRVTPEKMRVALVTARTMWSSCGSCEHGIKCRTHCEPDPDKPECIACLKAAYNEIYGDKK